ncbi:CENPQ protein, partial [Amia calva]|nr:CENPQ protein [Amia calva]
MVSMKPPRVPAQSTGPGPSHSGQAAGPRGRKKLRESSSQAGVSAAAPPRGKQKWNPLSNSSQVYLRNTLSLAVLSVLSGRRKDSEESQRHLNTVKDRFLSRCEQLKVPPRKQGGISRVPHLHQAQLKTVDTGKKTLQALEAEVSAVVGELEQVDGAMAVLEGRLKAGRARLLEAESAAQEVLRRSEQAVLQLPPLSPGSCSAPTLQEEMLRLVPNAGSALQLAQVLQESPELKDMGAFLELAHGQADTLQQSARPR